MVFAKLPSLPKSRRAKPTVSCACGCGGQTKSTWVPGHDGRATGWAIRVEKGLLLLNQVPANERKGAVRLLRQRGTFKVAVDALKATLAA